MFVQEFKVLWFVYYFLPQICVVKNGVISTLSQTMHSPPLSSPHGNQLPAAVKKETAAVSRTKRRASSQPTATKKLKEGRKCFVSAVGDYHRVSRLYM